MTFHLVGLGLDYTSISSQINGRIKSFDKIYLESYTIEFPYNIRDLEEFLEVNIEPVTREQVESESILSEAKDKEILLLVYGDPFSATTHHQLILSCIKNNIPYSIGHNASIINSVAETGLSLYKFGKVCSMPAWKKGFRPTSFLGYVEENLSIGAHSLILVDIGLDYLFAVDQLLESLRERKQTIERIVICSRIGTRDKKIYFTSLDEMKSLSDIKSPYCFIIPSKLHFMEEDFLNMFRTSGNP